jgi:hypothetical protein
MISTSVLLSLDIVREGRLQLWRLCFWLDLNPYIITFGQPATIDSPCDLIPSARMYRFVNTKVTDTVGIAYDPVSKRRTAFCR